MVRLLRAVLLVGLAVATTVAAAQAGRLPAFGVAVAWLAGTGALVFWLPRAAHGAFDRGAFGRARWLYRLLRLLRRERAARGSAAVSIAACALAAGDPQEALRLLDGIDPARLEEAARAAWHNNRAYALARSGGDPRGALADSDAAIGLRPDVPGFHHTRGLALLGLGRLDEAIRELDEVWRSLAGGDAPPLLEAERCFDLGVAWSRKGEPDYAQDYFHRAVRAAPGSRWAAESSTQLGATLVRPGVVRL